MRERLPKPPGLPGYQPIRSLLTATALARRKEVRGRSGSCQSHVAYLHTAITATEAAMRILRATRGELPIAQPPPPPSVATAKPLTLVGEGGAAEALGHPYAPPPLAHHLHNVTPPHAATACIVASAKAGGGGGEQPRPLQPPRLPTLPSIPRSRQPPAPSNDRRRPDLTSPRRRCSHTSPAAGREGPDLILSNETQLPLCTV
jgi:hypothetical protein